MSDREFQYRDLEPHLRALTDAAGLRVDQVYKIVIKPRKIIVKHYLLTEKGHKYVYSDPGHPDYRQIAKGEVSIAIVREAK